MRRSRRRSSFNPFISLTDVLFNLVLVLIFASALFAQNISRQYRENQAFQQRLAAMQLERDELIGNIEDLTGELESASEREEALQESNLSLEEQIAGLVNNLDLAQLRQQRLNERITVLLGELDLAELENENLQERLTVVLGDLDIAESENRLLEEEVTIVLGDLEEARAQVSELSRNNFLVVELEWFTEAHDLDLHVTDPDGNRFFWNQPSYQDETSRLTLDNRIGARPNRPGLEIFTARDLKVGTYRIEVGLWGCGRTTESSGYRLCSSDSSANVLIRHRDGDDLIEDITIPAERSYAQVSGNEFTMSESLFDRLRLVAEVEVVEEDGERQVRVKPAPELSLTRLAGSSQTR